MSKYEIDQTLKDLLAFQARSLRARFGILVAVIVMYTYLIIYNVRHPP